MPLSTHSGNTMNFLYLCAGEFHFWVVCWTLEKATNKRYDFIDLRINITLRNSNQYRPKKSKLQNIIRSEKQIWTKTIDSRQRTSEIIDFIDLRINIRYSNQYRSKNSKLQDIIWSQKKNWIKTIDSRQRTSEIIDFIDFRINILKTVTSTDQKVRKFKTSFDQRKKSGSKLLILGNELVKSLISLISGLIYLTVTSTDQKSRNFRT